MWKEGHTRKRQGGKKLTVSRAGRDTGVGKDNGVRQGRNVPSLEDSRQTLSHSSQDSKRYLKVKTHIYPSF